WKSGTGCPFSTATTVGTLCTWKTWATRGLAATSTRATTNLPAYSVTTCSKLPLICALWASPTCHNSTTIGTWAERWITSFRVASVTSITSPSGVFSPGGGGGGAASEERSTAPCMLTADGGCSLMARV